MKNSKSMMKHNCTIDIIYNNKLFVWLEMKDKWQVQESREVKALQNAVSIIRYCKVKC